MPPTLHPGALVTPDVSLGDRQHLGQVGGRRPLDRVLGSRGWKERAPHDRVLHEVQQVGRGGPARGVLHGRERDTGGAAAQVAGSAGIAQLEPGGRHVLHDRLQLQAVGTNGGEREVAECHPSRFRRRIVPTQHRGECRHRDPPEHGGRFDDLAHVRIEVVEQHLDELLDDLCRRRVLDDEVGVADEGFARQLQGEWVTTPEAPRALGPVSHEALAGDEFGPRRPR